MDRRRRTPRRAVPRPLPTPLDEANGLLANAPKTPAAPEAAAVAPAAPVAPAPAAPIAPVVDAGAVGPGGGGGSSLGAAALRVAQTQRGVREIGSSNTGPQVDRYLEAAGVAPGNPWCASFVTWSLQQAGHKMPGGGWAAVATWVRNAEQGSQRPQARERGRGAARGHRGLRLGRRDRLRRRRPHRVPGQQRQGRPVHRPGGQQRRRGQRRPA